MSNRPVRSFFATLAVLGSVLPGCVATSASAAPAEPVVPGGGCWRYVPGPDAEIDDPTDLTDLSLALEPWAADPRLTLDTAGDTAVGGQRTFTLTIAEGPSVASPALQDGTATYFFDVIGPDGKRTELEPVEVDFSLSPGATAIPQMLAEGTFPVSLAGTSTLILRSVYFDLPALGQRLACNGQASGDAVVNPATAPEDTTVMAATVAVAAPTMAVTQVVGQRVVDAARPGDQVQASLSGFGSNVRVPMGLCGPGAVCAPTSETTTLPDGTALAGLVVPGDAALGLGTLQARSRLAGADVVREQPLRVLGTPVIEMRNTAGRNRLRAVGAEWDPQQEVRVIAVDDAGERIGRTVRVTAGATGRIDARLTVPADTEAAGIVATQQHAGTTLEATVDVPATAGGTGSDDADPDSSAGSGSGTSAGGSTPVAAPATSLVEIPAPVDLPVTTVTDPEAAAGQAGAGELAVTTVTLDGSDSFADFFGGGPERVLTLKVENVGTTEVVAPGLSIAVGKGEGIEPVYTSDGFARLAPGKTATLTIPIGLPTGAFGVYTVSGQIGDGDSGTFSTTWESYPWGLFVLNALGVLLIAFAVRRRVFAPVPSRAAALAGPPAAPGSDASAAVIDLEVLERWWQLQAAPDGAAVGARADTMADAVVDVAAVERWLERCSARQAGIDPKSVRSTSSVE